MLRRDLSVMGLWNVFCFTWMPHAATFINLIQSLPHPRVVSHGNDIKPLISPSRNTEHSTIGSPILKIMRITVDVILIGVVVIQSQNESFVIHGVVTPH